jgi:hypothetical protein
MTSEGTERATFPRTPSVPTLLLSTVSVMTTDGTPDGLTGWPVRLALWACMLVTAPLYLWFLEATGARWGDLLPAGDSAKPWMAIVVPLATFSFTEIAAVSWWYSGVRSRPILMGRTHWWFLIVFVAALSMAAGIIGSTDRDFGTVLLTAAITFAGITGLWLLPAALSPKVLYGLRKPGRPEPDAS